MCYRSPFRTHDPGSNMMNDGAALVDVVPVEVDPALTTNSELPDDVAQFQAKALGSVLMVPLALIRKNDVALRDVQRENEKYQTLVQSVRKRGVLNSILVREQRDAGGVLTYGLIDGLQRFSAATDAGQLDIPARIVQMDDAELLEAQIITNVNRIETKPAELSKHLMRILGRNPFMTRAQLAEKVCQSLAWVDERLSLNNLHDDIAKLVDSGSINLTNAYALAKIPLEEQPKHVDAAMSEPPKTFVPRMKARVKEIREAKKSGKDSSGSTFQPIQYMQKISDVKTELTSTAARDNLLGPNASEDAKKAWEKAILWILHFDELSQKEQLSKHEEREAKRKAELEKRKAENANKKEQESAKVAASIEGGW